jgi:hypothetical protein
MKSWRDSNAFISLFLLDFFQFLPFQQFHPIITLGTISKNKILQKRIKITNLSTSKSFKKYQIFHWSIKN